MKDKSNIKKTIILLIIFVLLAVSVCFSEVYAWFTQILFADATISGQIVYFDFKLNNSEDKQIVLTDSGDNPNVTYEKKGTIDGISYPTDGGMFPGQTMKFSLTLSNTGQLNSIFTIKIKNKEAAGDFYPNDCVITVKNNLAGEIYTAYVTQDGSFVAYPVSKSSENTYARPGTEPGTQEYFAKLPTGESCILDFEIYWPYEYGETATQNLDNSPYADAAEKNLHDTQYMKDSIDSEGNKMPFKMTIEVHAEQFLE